MLRDRREIAISRASTSVNSYNKQRTGKYKMGEKDYMLCRTSRILDRLIIDHATLDPDDLETILKIHNEYAIKKMWYKINTNKHILIYCTE
jgi:hypothetical protein